MAMLQKRDPNVPALLMGYSSTNPNLNPDPNLRFPGRSMMLQCRDPCFTDFTEASNVNDTYYIHFGPWSLWSRVTLDLSKERSDQGPK